MWTDFVFAEAVQLLRKEADRRVAVGAFHRGHVPCGLTLELSGGEAVRLNDWLDGSQITPSVSETIALL